MKILSINVSEPQKVIFNGKELITSIYKKPVSNKVAVSSQGIDGDRQADLNVHGGYDKAVYAYVNKMIVYYLGEQPKLNQVETFLCENKVHRQHVIENISKLVVKPANASGGYGIMIGPKAPKKEREEMIKKIKQNPREFVAQPLEILSTIPTISENGIEPRHLDLRPFILNGKSTYVTMGGLTRVALRKGSTIVNSSQGGGSKDTMVVET